jgi:hypothetical protein
MAALARTDSAVCEEGPVGARLPFAVLRDKAEIEVAPARHLPTLHGDPRTGSDLAPPGTTRRETP